MKEKIKLTENEEKVLDALFENTRTWGELCISFSYMQPETGLSIKEIGAACRSLKGKGYAEFYRGLMNDDGEVAGSGYCIYNYIVI